MASLLCMLETYQTFLTGLLGFAGVIITMIVNAKLQRDSQSRQMDHEANAIRVAIKSELIANKNAYENRIQQFDKHSDFSHALVPINTIDSVFKSLQNKIGLLTETELENIFNAYLLIQDLPYRTIIYAGTDAVGGLNNDFIKLDKEQQTVVSDMHRNFLLDIERAIQSIDDSASR